MKAIENVKQHVITMKTKTLLPGINELTDQELKDNKDQLEMLTRAKMIKGINLMKAEKI